MNALAELFRLPETKVERQSFVLACIDEIKEGLHNPLNIDIQLKNLEETIKAIRSDRDVKDIIITELNKYSEMSFKYNNVTFTKKAATTYDYSNDSKWLKLKEDIKNHEGMLKNIQLPIADTKTGEIYQPAIKKSTDSYSITFD